MTAHSSVTRCARCNVPASLKPLVPGKRVCEQCDEYRRRYNDRRRAAKREWNRKRFGHRPMEEVVAAKEAVYRERIRLLRAWAERAGRVPTLTETAQIIGVGINNPKSGGNGVHSRSCPQHIRRAAFNLKAVKTGRKVIPYPVPAEYQNGGDDD